MEKRVPRGSAGASVLVSAWAFSIVGHAVAFGLAGLALAASLGRPKPVALAVTPAAPASEETFEIQLPTVVDGSQLVDPPRADPKSEAVLRGGGEATPRLDTGAKGRGGDAHSPTAAINLADRDDDILLSPDVMSRMDRTQLNRILASKRRASREDWRASREPMELTFLAEGSRDTEAVHREHRRNAARDPSSGASSWGGVYKEGATLGAEPPPSGVGISPQQIGVPVEGAQRASVGRGLRDGAPGEDHRDTALVAYARPMVNAGTPSVASDARDKPTDNVDSEQEVATRMQSLLHASTAGGARGAGAGGEGGPGAAAAGGTSGAGSSSHALGTGPGPGVDSDPRDKRRSEYMRRVIAKLGPFTHWRRLMSVETAAEGVQGVAIVSFTILADGTVTGVALTRSSGVAELDTNFQAAISRAAPFPPLPAELGTSFRWAFPLDFRNPAVAPKDPSRGGRSREL